MSCVLSTCATAVRPITSLIPSTATWGQGIRGRGEGERCLACATAVGPIRQRMRGKGGKGWVWYKSLCLHLSHLQVCIWNGS